MRELEHELEATLFDRNGPRIALTPAGERLYQLARPLVEGMDDLPDAFTGQLDEIVSGDLSIAAGRRGNDLRPPPGRQTVSRRVPEVRVEVRSGTVGEGLELLLAGDVELMFAGAMGPVSQDVLYRPVLSYDLVLITSLDHPLAGRETVSPEEIAAWPVIVPDFGTYSMQGGESPIRQLGIEANVVIEVGGWDVVERYVEDGLGIAFYGTFCVGEESRVSVIPLRQYFAKRTYGWFVRRGKLLSRPAEQLIRVTDSEYPDEP